MEDQANKNVGRSINISKKLIKKGIGGEKGYVPEFAKKKNAKMMTIGLNNGTLKKIPNGYKRVDNKILTDKQAKNNLTKKNVEKYSKAMDKATKMTDKSDYEFEKAKAMRKKIGKTAVGRAIASFKNKTPEAKAYNKQWNKASELGDKAYEQELRAKELYKKTGKNRVSRILNNARYSH